jgi:hypothetical protein
MYRPHEAENGDLQALNGFFVFRERMRSLFGAFRFHGRFSGL